MDQPFEIRATIVTKSVVNTYTLPLKLFGFYFLRRNRVVAALKQRIAAQYSEYAEAETFERSVNFNRLKHILRAGGGVSARPVGKSRGKGKLIGSDKKNHCFFD